MDWASKETLVADCCGVEDAGRGNTAVEVLMLRGRASCRALDLVERRLVLRQDEHETFDTPSVPLLSARLAQKSVSLDRLDVLDLVCVFRLNSAIAARSTCLDRRNRVGLKAARIVDPLSRILTGIACSDLASASEHRCVFLSTLVAACSTIGCGIPVYAALTTDGVDDGNALADHLQRGLLIDFLIN